MATVNGPHTSLMSCTVIRVVTAVLHPSVADRVSLYVVLLLTLVTYVNVLVPLEKKVSVIDSVSSITTNVII